MTDAQKAAIQDGMPRFACLEDAIKFQSDPDWSLVVPRHLRKGNKLVPNPAWANAPYGQYIVWGPLKPV